MSDDSPPRPSVAAVVLNYMSAGEVVACVDGLRAQDRPLDRVIVIDNASPNDDEGRLRAALPREMVVQRGRNLGYGDGNNLGIEIALAAGMDFVWIVSPDVRVAPDCLQHLLTVMEGRGDVGICGAIVNTGGRTVLRWSVPEFLGYPAWGHTVRDAKLAALPDIVDTGFVEGSAMLIRARTLRRIGLFRRDFFLYYEDCELCLRARDAGDRAVVSTRARVEARWNDGTRNRRYYYMTRNSIALARLRRRYVGRAVLRNLLLCPFYVLLKRQQARTGLAALRDGLSMPVACDS